MQNEIHKFNKFKFPAMRVDFATSLGSSCRSAYYLRKNHLRVLTSPIDWMINDKLEVVYELIKTDFNNFFLDCSRTDDNKTRTINVKDNVTGMISTHHFFINEDLNTQAQRFNIQAIRRWNLIKEKIYNAKCVLFLRNGKFDFDEASDFLIKISTLFDKWGGMMVLVNVSHDENLASDEVEVSKFKLNKRLKIISYKVFEGENTWGNEAFWNKMMKSVKMPFFTRAKNAWNDFKFRFIRSCKKRIEFFTKKYKYSIDESH